MTLCQRHVSRYIFDSYWRNSSLIILIWYILSGTFCIVTFCLWYIFSWYIFVWYILSWYILSGHPTACVCIWCLYIVCSVSTVYIQYVCSFFTVCIFV